MIGVELIPQLTCAELIQLASVIMLTVPLQLNTDPNIALIKGDLTLEKYYEFQPTLEYLKTYNQSLYVLSPDLQKQFENYIGQTCNIGAFLLRTDSLYSRIYADSHLNNVDMYVLSGLMDFYQFDCSDAEFYQLRDSRIYDLKEQCRKMNSVELKPCYKLTHQAKYAHSVKIKELMMLRLLCFNE